MIARPSEKIWLVSEKHRRSTELSRAFGAELCELLSSDSQIPILLARYSFIACKTLLLLLRRRPKVVFVQNPSVFLALVVCGLQSLFGYKLIVDRHSNFKLKFVNSKELKWKLFHIISNYTIQKADLTIVTNDFLAEYINEIGGETFILPDKLPKLDLAKKTAMDGEMNIVVVCTFSEDEPIEALIGAAYLLPKNWVVYFTGNEKKCITATRKKELEQRNIRFTGFVSDVMYQSLLFSADIAVVLTTEDYLLTCGAYEAISLGKALVVSNTKTIKNYFRRGVIYTDPTPEAISVAIKNGMADLSYFESEIISFRKELSSQWEIDKESLKEKIDGID